MSKTIRRSSTAATAAVTLALVLGACGSSGTTSAASTTAPAAGSSTTANAPAASSTTGAAGAATTAAATSAAAATGSAKAVSLGEWFVKIPDPVPSGNVSFALTNDGNNTHSLAVAKGVDYASLPHLPNGAVDTDTLGADFIGASNPVPKGGTGTVSFNLPAGQYVFFCPVAFGPSSHAKSGQVLSVTVS